MGEAALRDFVEAAKPINLSGGGYITGRSGPASSEADILARLEIVEPILDKLYSEWRQTMPLSTNYRFRQQYEGAQPACVGPAGPEPNDDSLHTEAKVGGVDVRRGQKRLLRRRDRADSGDAGKVQDGDSQCGHQTCARPPTTKPTSASGAPSSQCASLRKIQTQAAPRQNRYEGPDRRRPEVGHHRVEHRVH